MPAKFNWNKVIKAAYAAYMDGRHERCERLLERHLPDIERSRSLDDRLAYTHQLLGSCLYCRADYGQARLHYQQAARLYRRPKPTNSVDCLYWLGLCSLFKGEVSPAARAFGRALALARTLPHSEASKMLVDILSYTAHCHWTMGKFKEAEESLREALKEARHNSTNAASLGTLCQRLMAMSAENNGASNKSAMIKLSLRAHHLLKRKLMLVPPPRTSKTDQTDDYFGTAVPDAYRWLEDTRSKATQEWLKAQNQHAALNLDKIPGKEFVRRRVWELYQHREIYLPYRVDRYYFFEQEPPGKNRTQFCRTTKLGQFPKIVLDGNALPENQTVMWRWVSGNGRYVAYTLSENGSEWQSLHIKNIDDGKQLRETLPQMRCLSLAWNHDNSGFYYTGLKQSGEQNLCFHKLGRKSASDALIYAVTDSDILLAVTALRSNQALLMSTTRGSRHRNSLFLKELYGRRMITLFKEQPHEFVYLGDFAGRLYFLTDKDAPLRRVISIKIDPAKPGTWPRETPRYREEVPESDELLQRALLGAGFFVGLYATEKGVVLRRVRRGGELLSEHPLPPHAALVGQTYDAYPKVFLKVEGTVMPESVLRFNVETGQLKPFLSAAPNVDVSQYTTEKIHALSKDGTKVPVYVSYKKGLVRNGDNPTFLTGYGGFGVSMQPSFDRYMMAWMELGGIYAQSVLRGGGEFGRNWRDAGKLEQKQNTFNDFIAVARHLISRHYTRPARLAIAGTSNGGLLAAAALTQQPQLFGACVISSALLDMLRYHKFDLARHYISEYGSAGDPKQFKALCAYSPLHNLKRRSYPPTLITAETNDDRVSPMHSYKFAAALQENQSDRAPILLRVHANAGHDGHRSSDRWLDTLCFVAEWLGVLPERVLRP